MDFNTQYKINFIHEKTVKKNIVIHHTVGGSAISSINYWNTENNGVGCPYIIERDGTIYQTFNPSDGWIYHLGVKLDPKICSYSPGIKYTKGDLDKVSIGIELASEGGLYFKDDKLYNFKLGNPYKGKEYIKLENSWRGFQYFDQYEPAQLESLYSLVIYLIQRFNIERNCVVTKETVTLEKLMRFNGIYGHYNIRLDKTDPHLQFDWQDFCSKIGLLKYNQLLAPVVDGFKLKPEPLQKIKI